MNVRRQVGWREVARVSTSTADVQQLGNHKLKVKKPGQRSCNEKDAKGKLCAGHLKRWYFFGDDVKSKLGGEAEVYRCEHCKTLYLPNPNDPSGINVADRGQISTFGLTLPPKDVKS